LRKLLNPGQLVLLGKKKIKGGKTDHLNSLPDKKKIIDNNYVQMLKLA